MDKSELHHRVERYALLKKRKTALQHEMDELRAQIIAFCEQQERTELETGRYLVKLIHQERKEYDDQKLYDALPDPDVWRLVSKADGAKIASMVKLNILNEAILSETYTLKRIALLQVEKL